MTAGVKGLGCCPLLCFARKSSPWNASSLFKIRELGRRLSGGDGKKSFPPQGNFDARALLQTFFCQILGRVKSSALGTECFAEKREKEHAPDLADGEDKEREAWNLIAIQNFTDKMNDLEVTNTEYAYLKALAFLDPGKSFSPLLPLPFSRLTPALLLQATPTIAKW